MDVADTDDRWLRLVVVKQHGRAVVLPVNASPAARRERDPGLAGIIQGHRTQMRRQSLHDDGVVIGAADGVLAHIQPWQTDKGQPAVGGGQACKTFTTPRVDGLCVRHMIHSRALRVLIWRRTL